MRPTHATWLLVVILVTNLPIDANAAEPVDPAEITFNTNFEGGSIGRVEKLSPVEFRLHVAGQHDQRGRNRQASWYFVRLDHVRGRELKLTLTDLVGEYNDKPGAVPGGPDILPVISEDGRSWKHVESGAWDDVKKEMTVTLKPAGDTVWLAHVPPYTPADLSRLLEEARRHSHAIVEVIGKTVRGRDMHSVTITDPAVPDAGKKHVWVMARQHAWEAGTSWVAEGAIRHLLSDDAKTLRRENIFRILPMVDVDGCAEGKVRFNANGYDVNRHWDLVDLRNPEFLAKMPEIWYAKKAVISSHRATPIDLLLNLHNTETAEYLETHARDEKSTATFRRLHEILLADTSFDPSRPFSVSAVPTTTTNSLSRTHSIPVALMELRIATTKKLGRRPTTNDRLAFGRALVIALAGTARDRR